MSEDKKRVVVLGGGRVGAAMVKDLAADGDLEITLVDAFDAALEPFADDPTVTCEKADLSMADEVRRVVGSHDLVIGAVPGPMGFATVRAVIEAGKDIVDISFFEEDAFELNALAHDRGVVALMDCGVAPGASNLILGRMLEQLDTVDSFACYVGGLPVARAWPFEYKAPFSPIDVIAEYTRPVRLREHGTDVTRPALGRSEFLHFDGIGTLEAFETDGLRTLMRLTDVPNMIEKTLRFPGHREKMEILRETGFFGEEPITLKDGTTVRPLDVTAQLLFDQWRAQPDEQEFTVLRVILEGREGDQRVRHTFDLYDRTDTATGTSSMARTTGYTCTAMARLVTGGHFKEVGISPPEVVGRDQGCYDRIMADLEARGVKYHQKVEQLG